MEFIDIWLYKKIPTFLKQPVLPQLFEIFRLIFRPRLIAKTVRTWVEFTSENSQWKRRKTYWLERGIKEEQKHGPQRLHARTRGWKRVEGKCERNGLEKVAGRVQRSLREWIGKRVKSPLKCR